jgi:uncharacterized damage-inducible protein DinB
VSGPRRVETRIVPAPGCRSREVAVKVSEIAAVHALLREASEGLTPAELERQPAPGRNTLGMLLAHVAVAETHLGQVGLLAERDGHVHDVLGIGAEDDGLPLAAGAAPPAALAGRDLAFFHDLLERAHAHTRQACAGLEDADLAASIVRPPRPDGTERVFDRRYILFHMVEHAALHLGQLRALRAALPRSA